MSIEIAADPLGQAGRSPTELHPRWRAREGVPVLFRTPGPVTGGMVRSTGVRKRTGATLAMAGSLGLGPAGCRGQVMSANRLGPTGEGEGGRPLGATLYRHVPGSLLAVLASATLGACVAGVWSNDVPAKTGGPVSACLHPT
jgi:hypothetical protein